MTRCWTTSRRANKLTAVAKATEPDGQIDVVAQQVAGGIGEPA